MSLIVVGISHKTAPVELREKLAFDAGGLEKMLRGANENSPFKEIAVLSTCNRTEIYGLPSLQNESAFAAERDPKSWCVQLLERYWQREGLENFLYVKQEREMILHLFSVASGLDSLVLGENEILKQVKDSYLLSQKLGATGKVFNVLFQRALYVGKLVRTHTAIGQGAVSVGSVAVALAEKIFGDLSNSTVLVLGAGKMAEISARYLLSKKVRRLLIANRTVENARLLAEKFPAQALTLEDGMKQMQSADIVITSLSLSEPLISKKFVSELMLKRRNKSLFLIDIAVPRNVEAAVHAIDNVYLYNIDDVQTIVQENIKNRSAEIAKAARIVKEKSDELYDWYCSLKSGEEKSLKHFTGAVGESR